MTQPAKPHKKPAKEEDRPVTIQVRQRSRVRWGLNVYGPGRQLQVPESKLGELEGDYDEVT